MTTTTRQVVTYCRICPATCGLVLDVVDTPDGRLVTKVVGDEEHPLTRGFTCTKGRHIADLAQAPNRLRSSRRFWRPPARLRRNASADASTGNQG